MAKAKRKPKAKPKPKPKPKPTARGGRDPATGRFLTGNNGGPGSDKGSKRQLISNAFYAAVTPTDMTAIVKKLVENAKGGDPRAAAALLERFVPKTPQSVDLTGEVAHRLEGVVHLDFGD